MVHESFLSLEGVLVCLFVFKNFMLQKLFGLVTTFCFHEKGWLRLPEPTDCRDKAQYHAEITS